MGTMIQQPRVSPTEMSTNVRVSSLGGLPHQPIVSQRVFTGPLVARRIRRDASAAPRRMNHEARSAMSIPTTPTAVATVVLLSQPVARPSAATTGSASAKRNAGSASSFVFSASTIRSASMRARRSSRRSWMPGIAWISRRS
jgi:hypothetical protein